MRFDEVMAGTWDGRPFRMELTVTTVAPLNPFGDATAVLAGRVVVPGLVDDPNAFGTIRIAPVRRGLIHYQMEFRTLDDRILRLDGKKLIRPTHPVRTMTTLPATVTDDVGGTTSAILRFEGLWPFLTSLRASRDLMTPRWKGASKRLEVWYATLTDVTGTGYWLHHETVAPTNGPPRRLGWLGVYPVDGPPSLHRSDDWDQPLHSPLWTLHTTAGTTLHTFPAWSWRYPLLPASHVLAAAGQKFTGTILGQRVEGIGGTARVFGKGNARRWAWLHADFGCGDVLEIVAAASHRLPVTTFLRLRLGGRTWPAPWLSAALLRTDISLPQWSTRGQIGNRRIRVHVDVPAERRLAVDYINPDGAPVVCHNSGRSDAWILLERRAGGKWLRETEHHLVGTAHAEVGSHV